MNENQDMVDEVQIGRVLHFVIEKGQVVQCRPALVVEDWPNQGKPGYCNLVVFPDGTNDGAYGTDQHMHNHGIAKTDGANTSLLVRWETSVLPNHAVRSVRSWHWPRECVHLSQPPEPFVNEAKERFHHNHATGVVDIHNCIACNYASKVKVDA